MLRCLIFVVSFAQSATASCNQHFGNNHGSILSKAEGVDTADGCCDACRATSGCVGYTYVHRTAECLLKDAVDDLEPSPAFTSAAFSGPPPPPTPPPPLQQTKLGKGWNLGNTLDMTQWQQAREEWIFQSVKEKGFDWVRIPVQWGARADASGNIYGDFMGQVEETVGWAKKHGLVALINAHHEDWFDNGGSLDRLVNIWRQIAEHFKGYGDNELVFEIFNEPNAMSLDTLNQMNRAVLSVIRKNNPTRLVFLGGLKQMGRWWINANPDAMQIPAGDENLGLTVHSYDPYSFAGPQPSLNSFGDAEVAAAEDQQRQLSAWARARGIKQVVLNEFGVTVQQSNRYDRLKYYHANSQACAKQGQGYAIWDDNGWWQVLNRNSRSWDEGVLENLVSPHKEIVGV